MKTYRIRKQGIVRFCPRKRSGQIRTPFIDMESLSVKPKKDGVFKAHANLISSPPMKFRPRGKLLKLKIAEAVQELAHKKEIGPDCLIDVRLKGLGISHVADGVWPPYRVVLEDGIVVNVEIIKKEWKKSRRMK